MISVPCFVVVILILPIPPLHILMTNLFLSAYDCDVERTLDYFLTQREKSKTAPVKAAVVPPKAPTSSVVKSSPTSTTNNAKAKTGTQQQQTPNKSNAAVSGPAPSDLDMMGFEGLAVVATKGDLEATADSYHEKAGSVSGSVAGSVSVGSTAPSSSSSASSALLVASAPLSDDEYEGPETGPTNAVPHHVTLVVAGHVDAGDPRYYCHYIPL